MCYQAVEKHQIRNVLWLRNWGLGRDTGSCKGSFSPLLLPLFLPLSHTPIHKIREVA